MKKSYFDSMHTVGRVWSVAILLLLFAVPLAFSLKYDEFPQLAEVLTALAPVAPLFYITAVVEVTAYTPLLGTGGMYLSFATGNISNLKLPCALSAMESAHVKSNSEEGEVITTIAIAVSSIVTTIIIAVFVLALRPVIPYLNDPSSPLSPAFAQVLPALFGALGAQYFYKHWKIGLIPLVFLCAFLAVPAMAATPVGTLIPIGVVVSLVGAEILYKTKKL
ncbi:MAG: hypothetical protein K6C36_03390 [Clostridia bacterium]|nr:hypothetical protein [Clostridia bacterium]